MRFKIRCALQHAPTGCLLWVHTAPLPPLCKGRCPAGAEGLPTAPIIRTSVVALPLTIPQSASLPAPFAQRGLWHTEAKGQFCCLLRESLCIAHNIPKTKSVHGVKGNFRLRHGLFVFWNPHRRGGNLPPVSYGWGHGNGGIYMNSQKNFQLRHVQKIFGVL